MLQLNRRAALGGLLAASPVALAGAGWAQPPVAPTGSRLVPVEEDEIAITLREIIAKHYREVMGRTNEVDMIFVRKAHELANTDSKLKELLEIESGKEDAKDPQPNSDWISR